MQVSTARGQKMKALILKNIGIEGAGTFGDYLEKSGYKILTSELADGEKSPVSAEGFALVAIMGGPMSVYEEKKYPFLREELSLIEDCLKNSVKVIGFCLGAQLIARALGAKVIKNRVKEIGWFDLHLTGEGTAEPLFEKTPETFRVFQWHGDRFDIPETAVRLARSELCENQAFVYKNNALALQFHLEISGEHDVETWCKRYMDELTSELGDGAMNGILDDTRKELPIITPIAERFYQNVHRWITLR